MSAGYFSDGSTTVGLDENPSARIDFSDVGPIELAPWDKNQPTFFQRGGGYLSLVVQWGLERFNRGDAEWYVYQKCLDLGSIGRGELYVNGLVYENAVCTQATAAIERPAHDGNTGLWSNWVQMITTFEVSLPEDTTEASPTYEAPATPGEYAARTSDGAFTFDGNTLSDEPLLLVPSMRCHHPRHWLPRAYGVRHDTVVSNRTITLKLDGLYWRSTRAGLEDAIRDLAVTVRDKVGSLVGNGNTYTNCHISEGFGIDDQDLRFTDFGISFIQAS